MSQWVVPTVLFLIFVWLLPLRFGVDFRHADEGTELNLVWVILGRWHVRTRLPFVQVHVSPQGPSVSSELEVQGHDRQTGPWFESREDIRAQTIKRAQKLPEHATLVNLAAVETIWGLLTGSGIGLGPGQIRIPGNPLLTVLYMQLSLIWSRLQQVQAFSWKVTLGAGDAYVTSILSGAVWSAISSAMAGLHRRWSFLTPPRIRVNPDFDQPIFSLRVYCIFRTTPGEIMISWIAHRMASWRRFVGGVWGGNRLGERV